MREITNRELIGRLEKVHELSDLGDVDKVTKEDIKKIKDDPSTALAKIVDSVRDDLEDLRKIVLGKNPAVHTPLSKSIITILEKLDARITKLEEIKK